MFFPSIAARTYCFQSGFAKSLRIALDQIQRLLLHPDRQHHSTTDRKLLRSASDSAGAAAAMMMPSNGAASGNPALPSRIAHADVAHLQFAQLLPARSYSGWMRSTV